MILKTVLNFAGTLIPILWPKNEFNPKNLAAVVVIISVLIAGVKFIGVESMDFVVDSSIDLIESVEE